MSSFEWLCERKVLEGEKPGPGLTVFRANGVQDFVWVKIMCADDMSVLDALHGRDGCFDDRSLYLVTDTGHKTRAMICRTDD